jgi:Ran GTPase-activating protein (RanGAP) involved in mRNA processing and transport
LAVLDLACNVIRDEGCVKLANAIKGNHASSLLWLSLERNGITLEGVQVLALTIRMRPCHLTHLDLSHNVVGLEGTEALAAALKVNLSMRSLRLASCRIGVNGAGLLAEALKTGCALTSLDLEDNRILGQGSAALANALSGSLLRTPITNLGLRSNHIEDGGAVVLAEALKLNFSLVILDLADNAISITGVSALAEALKGAGYNPTHARRSKHDDVMLFARRQQDLIDFYMRKDSSKVCGSVARRCGSTARSCVVVGRQCGIHPWYPPLLVYLYP